MVKGDNCQKFSCPLFERVNSKRKEFAPLGSKFLLLGQAPFQKGLVYRKANWK